jgi:hypothetical protein
MLEALELADGLAELFACPGVGDTHIGAFLRAAERVCRDKDKGGVVDFTHHWVARGEELMGCRVFEAYL